MSNKNFENAFLHHFGGRKLSKLDIPIGTNCALLLDGLVLTRSSCRQLHTYTIYFGLTMKSFPQCYTARETKISNTGHDTFPLFSLLAGEAYWAGNACALRTLCLSSHRPGRVLVFVLRLQTL